MKRCACVVLAAVVVAAGCGGSGSSRLSKSEYEAKLRSAFTAANAELGSSPRAPGSVAVLKRIGSAYSDIASALSGARVPPDVQAPNDRLAAAASSRASALKTLVSKLEAASAGSRRRLLAEYDASPAARDGFDQAVAALTAKGYRFRTSGGT